MTITSMSPSIPWYNSSSFFGLLWKKCANLLYLFLLIFANMMKQERGSTLIMRFFRAFLAFFLSSTGGTTTKDFGIKLITSRKIITDNIYIKEKKRKKNNIKKARKKKKIEKRGYCRKEWPDPVNIGKDDTGSFTIFSANSAFLWFSSWEYVNP